ncbi:uncharacterized protein LOC141596651 [Silene latifolia]|uniref:uncharacterized protein LOC141596651 n=1 Tax=Silene latifolia TaxID=37657 RepID=UPI003D76A45A
MKEITQVEMDALHNLLKTQLDPHILTTRLYDATIKGDLNSLHNLLHEDPLILDRCVIEKSNRYMQSPLHVAASLGHLDFTTEILRLKPELAKQLDQSIRSSPLHLAAEKGHLDVVEKLVEVMPNMCFERDQDGWNPVHLAAISNQLHVLDFLVSTNPRAARERTNTHETILHLCVKYAQLEPLRYSVNAMEELLNARDNEGNTVLHLAVEAKHPEVVKLLLANKKMQKNAINKDGLTAIDCLAQTSKNKNDDEIRGMLKRAKVLKAEYVEKHENKDVKWLNKQRTSLMVVASLIATMAFQFGVNPNWEPKTNEMSYFDALMIVNTLSFVSSLSVVLLLIGGLPCKRLFVVVLMITMWIAITATLLTYCMALGNPKIMLDGSVVIALRYALIVWAVLLTILLLGHVLRVLIKAVKKLGQPLKELWYKLVVRRDPVIRTTLFGVDSAGGP